MLDQWSVVNQLSWLGCVHMQWKIVADLMLDNIDSYGIVFIILGDNIVL